MNADGDPSQTFALGLLGLCRALRRHCERGRIANALSFANSRNMGGSIGIATATTMIARNSQQFTNVLGAHVTPYSPQAQALLGQLRAGFIAHGSDPVTATRQAYSVAFGMVQQQAALLSYLNAFYFFGLVFLVLLPLVLIMKKPAQQGGGVAMH